MVSMGSDSQRRKTNVTQLYLPILNTKLDERIGLDDNEDEEKVVEGVADAKILLGGERMDSIRDNESDTLYKRSERMRDEKDVVAVYTDEDNDECTGDEDDDVQTSCSEITSRNRKE